MIDLFIKLIENGIRLVKERKEGRKSFFDNVIAKQHDVFEKMCSQHLETFMEAQSMLVNDDIPESQILKYVESRILFESGTVELLKRVVDMEQLGGGRKHALLSIRAEYTSQSEEYEYYLALISKCILSPTEPVEIEGKGRLTSIAFYDSLHTLIDLLVEGWPRESILEGLEHVVIRFNIFYAEVQSSFFKLRREYIN